MSNLMAFIEFGGMGMIRDVKFDKNYLKDHRRAVVLFSDYDQTMWVWLGHETNINTRKQVSNVTEKFKLKGYSIDGEVLGLNCKNVVVIDERIISAGNDPQMQQNYQQLLQTIDSINFVPHGTSTHIVEVQGGVQVQPQLAEQVSAVMTSNLKDEAIGGIFLSCLLHEYPDAFVSRTNTGIFQFESSTGENFKFKVDQLKIQMLQGSINDKIQNLYGQLIQNLK